MLPREQQLQEKRDDETVYFGSNKGLVLRLLKELKENGLMERREVIDYCIHFYLTPTEHTIFV